MKIVILSPFFAEGLEYQENLLVKYYEKYHHEVHLITSTNKSLFNYIADVHEPRAKKEIYKIGCATIYRLPYSLNLFHRLEFFGDITPILETVRPDLIFVRDVMPNIRDCARYVRRHPECRMVMDYHADFLNSGNSFLSRYVFHRIVRKRFLDNARPSLSKIFPVTPGSADFLRKIYSVKDCEMEVLPLGADVDLANSVTQSNAGDELRRTYGISPDATVIFSGGKLVPMKRTEILVDAFRALPSGNIRLVIAGDAPRGDPYKRVLLDRAAGDDRIRFVGWLTPLDIYRHLDLADIAVFPGSQSILWQQAISMGLPLIVGTMNGRQDVTYLNKYGNILVADSMKPLAEGVCEALSQLVGDDELRARMAEGARRVRAELLDWNKLIHRTLRFNGPADASKSTDPGIHETGNLRT